MDFSTVLKKIRGGAFSERDKGDKFERLIANWLLTDPRYASKFSKVWMWADFPARADLGGNDTGIDLVARTIEGDYWAIQCKCYEKGTVITKAMVDTFISTSGRQFPDVDTLQTTHFACCLWVSTSDVFGRNASESTSGQSIPFCRIGFGDLANSAVDWQKLWDGLNGAQAALPCKQPMEHQTIAVNKAMDYFASHDRGKLIMACGTGKTYTALKIAETMTGGNGLVLFMVPSIALLGQSLNAWCADASEHIAAVCVCSDHTANRRARNGADAADADERTFDLAYPASTDADNIARQLIRIKDEDGLKVVFSTYQSVMAVSKAQQEVLRLTSNQFGVFSLIVCDEAHRTTGIRLAGGSDESEFTKIHSNDVVRADKRLYMTATPRLYKSAAVVKAKENDCVLCSMDDASIYGEEFFRVNFSYAVQHNLLTDYKVLVLTVSESDIPQEVKSLVEDVDRKEINADETAKFVGVINGLSKLLKGDDGRTVAADPGLMRRAVAFCQKIGADDVPNSSKNMASVLPLISEKYNQNVPADRRQQLVSVQTRHVDGSMDASQRDELLYWLKEESADPAECRVLCNVRCLSEGVDVPALDAVLFMSPRNSQVDVVQSVGRVMRNFRRGQEGEKKYGYIIIPIVIPDRVTPEEALNDNERFKVVWDILNALRSHDDNFNAEVNSIELNRNKASKVTVTRPGYNPYDNDAAPDQLGEDVPQYVSHAQVSRQLDIRFGKWQECIYAKLVEKVGDRFYWENWAREVGLIARKLIDRITSAVERKADHKAEFDKYLKCLQDDINPSVDAAQAIEMLAQHIITRPVFDALFADYQFVENNSVSSSMQRMIELLDADAIGKDTEELARFYDSVRTNVGHIDNLAGKQTVIKNLYEKFFKGAFPLTTAKLGIVYTPVECVDFIIHSVDDVLRQEFGSCLSNENVHIIDPFVGTGTFVTRLLQSGLIRPEDMERKYLHEIHCNEIVLLAYYIADVNIESVYHELMHPQHYLPYDGICLTDTFQTAENREPVFDEQWFGQNTAALQQQRKLPIKVIIANPPYSIGQKSANDNAQNMTYAVLDQRVTDTYGKQSVATSTKALHDSYIKAFRWASDKIAKNEDGGVIGFISNGAWLDNNGFDGFRKSLEEEFSAIYVLNLRGNQRTQGELSRREGGKIFGSGSRTPVSITILVKKPGHKGKAVIHYHDIGDYLKREQKLNLLRQFVGVGSGKIDWQLIHPDKNGDWISHRNSAFDSLIPLNPDKKFDIKAQSVFNTYVIGVATNRDAWSYNFSEKALSANMSSMIDFYNAQSAAYKEAVKDNPNLRVEDFIDTNPQKISWTVNLKKDLEKKLIHEYNDTIRNGIYRPFCKQSLYYDNNFIERPGLSSHLFPTPQSKNLVICVNGIGGSKPFGCLISDAIPDLQVMFNGQCFPMYWYEENRQTEMTLFDGPNSNRYIRHDGITDWMLHHVQELYRTKNVTREMIFYYVYGLLHTSGYREAFETDLRKSLPRLPLPDDVNLFMDIYKVGQQLAQLHLAYEQVPAPDVVTVIDTTSTTSITSDTDVTTDTTTTTSSAASDADTEAAFAHYRVTKMKFLAKDRKDTIIYNSHITLVGIPDDAYRYVVNGKSAIEWLLERYCVSTDKASGIRNDANDWAREHHQPRYILNLLLSVISVSLRSVQLVNSLPPLFVSADGVKWGEEE